MKLYTGIIQNYNNISKSGTILVDASSDINEPNIGITYKDLPSGFIFTDSKLESTFIDGKTFSVNGIVRTAKIEVIAKNAKYITTKVSFNYENNKLTNLIII